MPSSSVPSLEALRVLAACVRRRSFSQAAAELHLTPSAVSLRMRNLEATLGVKLFVRHGPKLDATEAAIALAAKVDEALATIEMAVDHCRRRRRPLRVTCAPTFATRWLIPRLAAYHATPGSQPIALDATDAVLAPDRFDVAIRAGRAPWRGFASIELLPDEGTPMLTPSLAADASSLTPKRLLDLPLIPDTRWSRWFALAGLPDAMPTFAATRFATYELEAIAAVKGIGVALLSPFLYADLIAQHALVAPFDTIVEGPQSYFALWREGAAMPHFVRWMRKALDETRAQNP
jgi:LysR family glycine cleavage system transcriptional activator